MEHTRRTLGLSKGQYSDYYAQRDELRRASPSELLEGEDQEEAGIRYADSKQAIRAKQRARSLARELGRELRYRQD